MQVLQDGVTFLSEDPDALLRVQAREGQLEWHVYFIGQRLRGRTAVSNVHSGLSFKNLVEDMQIIMKPLVGSFTAFNDVNDGVAPYPGRVRYVLLCSKVGHKITICWKIPPKGPPAGQV